ncbi:enoyl-CoA hydratase [Aurantivibrio infirmus]
MSSYQQILFENKDRITTITLNRPDRLNAWTATMAEEVRDAVFRATQDKESRCIVITGAGRGFCAGADMGGLQDTADAGTNEIVSADTTELTFAKELGPHVNDMFSGRFAYLYNCPLPIIAAINGPCAGIGLIFALYADLRFTAENAKFTTAFSARGLVAEHGIAWLLPRLIGEANALDLLFTARKFTGVEAAELGLVNKALTSEELSKHVNSVASTLANDVSPRSIAIMKRQVRASYAQSFNESLTIADAEMNKSFSTFDFKEGVQSFVEKRAPNFKNL